MIRHLLDSLEELEVNVKGVEDKLRRDTKAASHGLGIPELVPKELREPKGDVQT
jgi:hypothetical protein